MDDLQTLLRPLVEQPETAPQPVEWIAGRARHRTRRRRGLQLATAAAVLAVPTWLVVRDDSGVDTTTGPADTASTTTTVPPTTGAADAADATGATGATGATWAAGDGGLGAAAPWSGAPLGAAAAPAYVQAAANGPDAAAKCPVVAPDDLGVGAAATPRPTSADETDRWGVSYDVPATSERGPGTFAVFAIVMPPGPGGPSGVRDMVTQRSGTHTWSDGSVAGWGDLPEDPRPPSTIVVDGEVIDLDEILPPPLPEEPLSTRGDSAVSEAPTTVVQFLLQDADPSCLYSVDSDLGRDHAFHLLEHLRRVEGT